LEWKFKVWDTELINIFILVLQSNKLAVLDHPFQYGPVIKLPLQINHMGLINPQQLLQIDQSDNFDTAFSQVHWVILECLSHDLKNIESQNPKLQNS
jgi:hypothetical protein